MALAALLYIDRVTETTSVELVTDAYIEGGRPHVLQDEDVPSYVTILRIHGPFLFGMTDKLVDATADLAEFVEHVGKDNILPHVQAALRRAESLIPGP